MGDLTCVDMVIEPLQSSLVAACSAPCSRSETHSPSDLVHGKWRYESQPDMLRTPRRRPPSKFPAVARRQLR
eukprot:scaffold8382_cov26-Tisochrysis_lutea.AAC.2